MEKIAILLSGGTGSRLGESTPKQYIEVEGKRIIDYVLDTIEKCAFDAVVVVADEAWHESILRANEQLAGKITFAKPGSTRQLSIWNALCELKEADCAEDAIVLIMDAARPGCSAALMKACMEPLTLTTGAQGVLPVLPMKDTVYLSQDGEHIDSLLERRSVVAGQAPEAFVFVPYYKANEILFPDQIKKINGSTEPAILAGLDVVTIPGEESNYKITTKEDLERYRESLRIR